MRKVSPLPAVTTATIGPNQLVQGNTTGVALTGAAGGNITVVNAGRGGEPAIGQGETRLPVELAATQPNALALLHGTNDAIGGQSPSAIAGAVRNMIRSARSAGVTYVLVSTLLPQRPGGTPPRGTASAAIPGINDAIRPMVASVSFVMSDDTSTGESPTRSSQCSVSSPATSSIVR